MPLRGNGRQNILCRNVKHQDKEKLQLHIEWQILFFFPTFLFFLFLDYFTEIKENCESIRYVLIEGKK